MSDNIIAVIGLGIIGAVAVLVTTRTSAEINGCTNSNADNYNSNATVDDGSCLAVVQQQEQNGQHLTPIEDLIPDDFIETSVWKSDGLIITLEHPLAATNSEFESYYFTAKLVIDIMHSGIYNTWAEVPETFTGDYTWELTRHGGLSKWTNESHADDIRGLLSKTLLGSLVDSIMPTFDTVLNAFGGYVLDYPAVNLGSIQIQSGTFRDTGGDWRYVDSNGTEVSNQQIVLDLLGNQINPAPLQMQVKCSSSSSWTDVLTPVTVIGSLIAENETGSIKFFPADAPNGYLPSGLLYGCTIPTTTHPLPQSIRVVDTNGTQISIDDLISPVDVEVESRTDVSAKGYIYTRIFQSEIFPRVQKDNGGYFIMWGTQSTNLQKAYISTLVPGFNALYLRRQIQCQCPGSSNMAGQTVTIYDTNNCPSWYSTSKIDEHCGGTSSGTDDESGFSGFGESTTLNAETIIKSFNSYQHL